MSGSSKKKTVLKSQTRETVIKVRDYFQKEKDNGGPLVPIEHVVKRTAAAMQISVATVVRINREKFGTSGAQENVLSTPGKHRIKVCPKTNMDSFQEDAIRRHIYAYYERKEYPTKKRLLVSLREAELFSGRQTSLSLLLKRLGFRWKIFSGNRKLLLERRDIVAWRGRFLREIMDVVIEDVVWLDETWVNAGHSRTRIWTDESPKGTMNAPIGKGSRLILLHAGTAQGFIPDAKMLFV